MINLSRFSKMSFSELTSLPNYYIHEIYKLFADDQKARARREEEEKKKQEAQNRANQRSINTKDSQDVQNLRAALAGANTDDLENLLEDLD